MRVFIVGSGYVGLTTAVTCAACGHTVVCQDVDSSKILSLREGRVPFYEPHLEESLQHFIRLGRISFSSSASGVNESDVVFVAVGTPLSPLDDGVDMSYVWEAAYAIRDSIRSGAPVVVNKSTVPVGSARKVASIVASEDEQSCRVVSNPEFLREGSALLDSLYPDRIVIGSDSESATHTMRALYAPIVGRRIERPMCLPDEPYGYEGPAIILTTPRTAEMIKYASNSFLATKVSFINEMAQICEGLGADVRVVADAMGKDRRIGRSFLNAGIGWGGSCFGKDVRGLIVQAREVGYEATMLKSTISINASQRLLPVERLKELLGSLDGKVIAVRGLAFKPNTDDLRDAPSLDLIDSLLAAKASVRAFDPVAMETYKRLRPDSLVTLASDPYDAVDGVDGLVLATEWDAFCNVDWRTVFKAMRCPIVIDGRNVLDAQVLEGLGFVYRGVGVPRRK